MFDLTIYPISLEAGREQNDLPGLFVSATPKKAARVHAQDQLVLYLHLVTTDSGSVAEEAAITPAQTREILTRLAETYYSFSGSVTAGLRLVTARLNDFLYNRNRKAARGMQTIGLLNMAVARGSVLTIAHAGPTHTFLLGKNQTQHLDDSLAASTGGGRGLGMSIQSMPRFYQMDLDAGDVLVMSATPPAAWTAKSLANSQPLAFDLLRRRLLNEAGGDLRGVVIRFQPGKGQMSYWRPGAGVPGTVAATPAGAMGKAHVAAPAEGRRGRLARQAAVQPAEVDTADFSTPAPTAPAAVEPLAAQPETAQAETAAPAAASMPEEPAGPVIKDEIATAGPAAAVPGAALPANALAKEPPAAPPTPATPRPRTGASASVTSRATTGGVLAGRRAGSGRSGSAARGINARGTARTAAPRTLPSTAPLRRWLAGALRDLSAARARAGAAVTSTAHRLFPGRFTALDRGVPFFNFSTGFMMMVAIVIPLLVVTVATVVYFRAGRAQQFDAYLLQAQQYAQQATQQTDPALQRESWTHAYELVRRAEQYSQSADSNTLRLQAQGKLDELEGYIRLHYMPAVRGGFSADVNITRIATTLNDVYLLDSSVGRILRLYRTATGYDIDPRFSCGPGKAGTTIIGPLVDLAALPPANKPGASVIGIDAAGNLVYCSAGEAGLESRFLAPPDPGWKKITGILLFGDTLYVLDPPGNAVYRYQGTDSIFNDKPHLYFDESIPKMADVTAFAVDQEFLYLMHVDGQMTICEGGAYSLAKTHCTDTPYGDTRAGFEPSPLTFPGAQFLQIQTTQPPDPSLYALDTANKSIYHLSLRKLNLQRQYRPQTTTDFPLPNSQPTAFAIAPNRRALLAFGNQVFFAVLP